MNIFVNKKLNIFEYPNICYILTAISWLFSYTGCLVSKLHCFFSEETKPFCIPQAWLLFKYRFCLSQAWLLFKYKYFVYHWTYWRFPPKKVYSISLSYPFYSVYIETFNETVSYLNLRDARTPCPTGNCINLSQQDLVFFSPINIYKTKEHILNIGIFLQTS